ncbi:hypothetical protein QYE76_009499 [Lolium multiflorum]|uniref:Uncharacterized protein n=1 Tax=Lolium multiflorum TaxID=4521 RepID=A0AAD8TVE3_LOLMU|nr:hypothetical protein QYE76_009499 [Lolium multiflorum]
MTCSRRAPPAARRPGPAWVRAAGDRVGALGLRPPRHRAGDSWPCRPGSESAKAPPEGMHPTPERAAPTGPTREEPAGKEPAREEPSRQEPAREEPARPKDADSRALVRRKGPSDPSEGLHGQRGPAAARAVVAERRTVLYNQVVTSYHKAKIERAGLARELEVAKAEAARVPQLESDLRAARAQCAESEEAGRAAAAKLKVADGELTRLRKLEANHLKELAALKKDGEEKLEGLSKRLEEVERQRLALREEVNSKSKELSATAKRWVEEISALDRGLAAAFPEAQEAALTAVGKAREARRQATGEQSSAFFTMDDYLASMAARVEPINKLGWELRKAAEELIRLLWPTETLP